MFGYHGVKRSLFIAKRKKNKNPEKLWEEYIKAINEKEENKDNHIAQIIDLILLPLRFLVKHAAFEDEQECRMIYITDIDDQKITALDLNQMYIEYEPNVRDSVDKVYLSPGAVKHYDLFRKILKDKDNNKVIVSKNPFRNKE